MVHGITKYQIRKMNNGSIRYSLIAILLFTVLLSSCLHAQSVPISSSFSIEVAEDKTSPVIVQLKNESYGADEYEWTFEVGEPSYYRGFYPFNEVYLEAPKKATKLAGDSPAKHKYVRLDSYVPNTEIVSRKYTQFDEVSEETAIRYLKELSNKYSPGSIIADVPSNNTGSDEKIFELNGDNVLRGQMILEVPVQKAEIPPNVLKYATDHRIKIRDIKGKYYN